MLGLAVFLLLPSPSSIILSFLVVLLFHKCQDAVSAFGGSLQAGRKSSPFGGSMFMMNSYLDSLSPKPNIPSIMNSYLETLSSQTSYPISKISEDDHDAFLIGNIRPSTRSYMDDHHALFIDETEISFTELDEEFIPMQGIRFDTTNEVQNILSEQSFPFQNMEILNAEIIEPEITLDAGDEEFISMQRAGFDPAKRVDYIEAQTYPELQYFSDENVETLPPLESIIERSAHYAMPLHQEPLSELNLDVLSSSYLDRQDEDFMEEAELSFAGVDQDFVPVQEEESDLTNVLDYIEAQTCADVPNLHDDNVELLSPTVPTVEPEDMFKKTRQARFSQARFEGRPQIQKKDSKPEDMFQKTRQARFSQAGLETSAHRAPLSSQEISPLSELKFDLLRREDDALLDRQDAELIDDAEISFANADEELFPIQGMVFERTKMTGCEVQPSLDVPNFDDNDVEKLPPLNFVEKKPEDMFQKTRQARFSQARLEISAHRAPLSAQEISPLSELKFDLLRREDDALLDRQGAELIDDSEISFANADEEFFPIPGMVFELTKMTDCEAQPSLDVPNFDDNNVEKLPPLNFVERKPEDMFQKTRQTRFSQSKFERSPPLRKESKPDDMFQKTRQARFSQSKFETSAHRAELKKQTFFEEKEAPQTQEINPMSEINFDIFRREGQEPGSIPVLYDSSNSILEMARNKIVIEQLTLLEKNLIDRFDRLMEVEQAFDHHQVVANLSKSIDLSSSFPREQDILGQSARNLRNIWEQSTPITIQGGSLRTWSYSNPTVKRVFVSMKTDGRPLDADVEIWQGPDNTPYKMKIYVEDGAKRTFSAYIDTPRSPTTIAIKNIGHMEFPLLATVRAEKEVGGAGLIAANGIKGDVIQGGALRTYPFESNVDSVAVLIKTDGRPLNARIELLQGPNTNKQVLEVYTENGLERPFTVLVQTPGGGNLVRVVNTAPLEFPMYANVAPYEMCSSAKLYASDGLQMGLKNGR